MTDIVPSDDIPRKQCNHPDCKQWFPATPEYFPRDRKAKDGLAWYCKPCVNKQHRAYMQRPEVKASQSAYFKIHHLTYYNRPGVKEHKQAYDKERRKKGSYYQRPEVKLNHCAHQRTRRARKQSVQGAHTPEQIQEQLKRQKYRCYYADCGHAKFERDKNGKCLYEIEHTYPLDRVRETDIPANDISYIVLACRSCNSKKGTRFPWEWPEGGRLL